MTRVQDQDDKTTWAENVTVGDFKLAFNPFVSPKDEQCTYVPDAWQSKFEFIKHLTLFNNVMTVLIADKGCGKSTFLSKLTSQLDEQINWTNLSATHGMSLQRLGESMVKAFDLTSQQGGNFHALVSQINQRRKHCLLLIDDAQLLKEGLLKELLKAIKSQGMHGYFHVLLASDYSLLEYLGSNLEADNEGLIHTIELMDLTAQQVRDYLVCMLTKAGYVGDFPLSNVQLNRLLKLSQGNIGKIDHHMPHFLADESCIEKSTEKRFKSRRMLPKLTKIAASSLPLLFAVFIVYTLLPDVRPDFSKQNLKLPQLGKQALEETQNQIESPAEINQALKPLVVDVVRNDTAIASVSQAPVVKPISDAKSTPVTKPIPTLKLNQGNKRLATVEKSPEDTSHALAAKASQYTVEQFSRVKPVVDSVVLAPKQLTQPLPEVVARPKPVKQVLKAKPITPVKSAPNNKVTKKSKPVTLKATKQANYAIQLLATHNLGALKQFVRRNNLKGNSHVYQFTKKGKHWYVLTIGAYGKSTQAKQELGDLPAHLAKLKPWVRQVSALRRVS